MANELWLNLTGCFLLTSCLSVFMPILGVPLNQIFRFAQRVRESALDAPARVFPIPQRINETYAP
jgi:hypothetical protein